MYRVRAGNAQLENRYKDRFGFLIMRSSELKTLEWNILNPDRLINLEFKNKGRTGII